MTTAKSDGNKGRPAAFDAAVLSYMGALKQLSTKLYQSRADREDIVNDTLARAFSSWRNFRLDDEGGYRGMYNWLTLNMRSIAQDKRRRKVPNLVSDQMDLIARTKGYEAPQLNALCAKDDLAKLRRNRAGRAILRLACGETLREVGKRYRVSGERIRQIADPERARFAKRIGYKVAA